MSPLEKKLMVALAEVLSLVDTDNLDQSEKLIYTEAVEVLSETMNNCDDCVDY